MIAYANWFQFGAGETIHNDFVESRMFLWCLKGKGSVRVDGRENLLEPGGWIFTPWKHDVHYEADPKRPFMVGGIHVVPYHADDRPMEFRVAHRRDDPLADRPYRRDAVVPGLEGEVLGHSETTDRLFLLGAFVVDFYQAGAGEEAAMRSLAKILLSELREARRRTAVPAKQIPGELHRMQEYIRSHLDRRLPVADLAQVGSCSIPSVHRLFRDYFATTPQRQITDLRMQRARELLRTSNVSVKKVGETVGFSDPFHFSRFFKKQMGVSPREYRLKQWF